MDAAVRGRDQRIRQIAGEGLINGEVHALLAIPCHRHDDRGECCENDDH